MTPALKDKIENYFKKYTNAIIEDVATLVSIPSVTGEPIPGKPFGYYTYEALDTALKMADGYDFIIKNHDGYVGTIDFNDKETQLAVFSHLDVVAPGDGWSTNPFNVSEKEGKLFGRGVSDDKGPAVAALYALKAIKDLGIELSKNVRLVLGTDEETGSRDLEYYFKSNTAPEFSFTPDANFPVTNGEKGRFSKSFTCAYAMPDSGKFVKSIKGGIVPNAVPSVCEAYVQGVDSKELEWKALLCSIKTDVDFSVEETHDGTKIVCTGISAHASLPELGNNPITALLAYLSSLDLDENECFAKIKALGKLFPHGDYLGKSFGIDMKDKLGELTLSLDLIDFESGRAELFFDARTPMCANEDNCAYQIASLLRSNGFMLEDTNMIPAHYVEENSHFIKTLLKNYQTFTGQEGECLSIGGGTYVHNIDGGVAFGAIRKDLNTNMHGADEFMYVEDIITAAKIFTAVIIDMCR